MTDPIRTSAPRPQAAPAPPPPPAAAPNPTGPSAQAGAVLELLDGVDPPSRPRLARCESHTASQGQRSADRAIDALVDGNDTRFDALLDGTRTLGALGRLSTDALGDQIGAAFDRGRTGIVDRLGGNYFATMRGVGRVETRVKAEFRERVRNEAIGALNQVVQSVALSDTAALTRTLAAAEPGSPEREIAQTLGVRGEPGDEARVRGALTDIVQSVRDFREHLFGGTWEPSDFPETTNRVLCQLGMREAPAGSILEDAIEGVRPMTDTGHDAILGAEIGHAVYEFAEAVAHPSLGTVGPFAVAVGGIVLSIKIHEAVQENIASRREFAAELGL